MIIRGKTQYITSIPFEKLCCGCLNKALLIISHQQILHIKNKSGKSCGTADRDELTTKYKPEVHTHTQKKSYVHNAAFKSPLSRLDPTLSRLRKKDEDEEKRRVKDRNSPLEKRWRRGNHYTLLLPSVSWPRQVDSSSSR